MQYLDNFLKALQAKWKGSLIRVSDAAAIQPNAKKFMGLLAKTGRIEKVIWGWYWVPGTYRDFYDFLSKDKNFKVLQKQSAAAFWNGDFIHRDHFSVAVKDKGFAKAVAVFARDKGWNVAVEVRTLKPSQYVETAGICVESLEETIIDCVKSWAFTDAFSAMAQNRRRLQWRKLEDRRWERIPGGRQSGRPQVRRPE